MGGQVDFGGAGGSAYSGYSPIFVDGIGLPVGKSMYNGSQACLITALRGLMSGGVATSIQLGNAGTGTFTAPGGSSPSYTGFYGTNEWLVQGGSTRFQYSHSGTLYFGRAGGGTSSDGHTNFSGTLGGSYQFADAPGQPTAPSLTLVGARAVRFDFGFNADQGGAAVNGYRVFWWYGGESPDSHSFDTGGSGTVVDGFTPGRTVYARVSAKNRVTDLAGTVGSPGGQGGGLFIPSGGKIYDAASQSWKSSALYIYDAASGTWKAGTAKVYDQASDTWKTPAS